MEIGSIDFHHFRSFCALRDARAPNQCSGLACADQGHPRAALDRHGFLGVLIGAQHPVKPYGQFACHSHLGDCLGLVAAQVNVIFVKLGVEPGHALR